MRRNDAIRQISVTEQTYYRWKKNYGGTGTELLKELKRLQKEHESLRRVVFDLTLDKLPLKGTASGNFRLTLSILGLQPQLRQLGTTIPIPNC